jgi:hypothetical protein
MRRIFFHIGFLSREEVPEPCCAGNYKKYPAQAAASDGNRVY